MVDVLVRVLASSRFSGVEGGGTGSQPWRCWWNGRLDSWHKTQKDAQARFEQIRRRGWA